MKLSIILYGLYLLLRIAAARNPAFRKRLSEKSFTAQIRTKDGGIGRWYRFGRGVRSKTGLNPDAEVVLSFQNARVGARLLTPPVDWLEQTSAQKNFDLTLEGPDELTYWFAQTLMIAQRVGWKFGTDLGEGVTRYTNMTNGGPCFVYVRDSKILRTTPIEFDATDPDPWTIEARGQHLTPPRKTTMSPHGQNWKSMVYSPDRLLYPMKRIDFDPSGERNPQNRGKSKYERITWDEAADIVGAEIKRMNTEHGRGAITFNHGSHHSWGNIGYLFSALVRFANLVGHTKIVHNPDSWEGWYWGAMHHWGNSMRLGLGEAYGTVEDLLKEAEMVVFWSSDPESTSGIYGGQEGTIRRSWLKKLGIKVVHIDPYFNHTAAFLGGKWLAPQPGTDTALALAIAYVWITEGLYDKDFIANRTVGFGVWRDYILGRDDGVAKTPEWQEGETSIRARVVRALAREWGSKKTYLGAGGLGMGWGGACRNASGIRWARAMVCLLAMQGLGRPGVNMGNLQWGTPIDLSFWFPGYGDGGISGDLQNTALAIQLYQRMPQLPTANTSMQKIPRVQLPEAIINGKVEGYPRDGLSLEGQFAKIRYPAPAHSPVRMLYKYGGTNLGTMPNSSRYIDMYRSPNLEFVVNQSIWMEGEAKFADIILPACTNFERWDMSEWSGFGGYGHHGQSQVNNRVIMLQHKCIEPLGESKSDYDIFVEISKRLGLSAYFSEGMSDLDWAKRMFDASDLPTITNWKDFRRKGYAVIAAPPPAERPPVAFNWFYEGRKKDTPEPYPPPSEYKEEFLQGLQTPSGKFEFECNSLKAFDPDDEERPAILKYAAPWEGPGSEGFDKFPLQLMSPHPRFSFHTQGDGKDSYINDIEDHRVLIDGHYYLVLRLNPRDAEARGIKRHDLVRVFNDRGAVICAAELTERILPGIIHGYESSAVYERLDDAKDAPEHGGCLNLLTPERSQIRQAEAMAPGLCLVEVEAWTDRVGKGAG